MIKLNQNVDIIRNHLPEEFRTLRSVRPTEAEGLLLNPGHRAPSQ